MPAKAVVKNIFFGGNLAGERHSRNIKSVQHVTRNAGVFTHELSGTFNMQTRDSLEGHYDTLSKLV